MRGEPRAKNTGNYKFNRLRAAAYFPHFKAFQPLMSGLFPFTEDPHNTGKELQMRIRYVRYFLVVAEELSFTRAAARVHIEPSPLSQAIRKLESDLEVQLLYRGKGKIRLTHDGEIFQEEMQCMLAFLDKARIRVQAAAKGYRGMLRIALADSLAQPRLTRLLARCREEEPLTGIQIVEMTVGEMVKALNHDLIDAGFTVHTGLHGLVKEVVWVDRPVIAIPKNHPLLSLDKNIPTRNSGAMSDSLPSEILFREIRCRSSLVWRDRMVASDCRVCFRA
jgi:DNA-binding transcriptional LysR family regulator